MNQVWNQYGSHFSLGETTTQIPNLPKGIYKLHQDPRTEELSLQLIAHKFTFQHKLYHLEDKFVARVKKTYENTTQNMGILLNGVKGTGKSVAAKQICNIMELPVIVVDAPYNGLVRFLNVIQEQVVVLIDEYEKLYKNASDEILTIMDGVHSNEYRRMFILTTNHLYISTNLLQRPGRLRYVKTFGDMSPDAIEEVVDDLLIYPEFKDEVIASISRMSILTIDLVKAIVQEVNIHEESPKQFMDYLNVNKADNENGLFTVFPVEAGGVTGKEPVFSNIRLHQGVHGLQAGTYISDASDNYVARVVEKYGSDTFKIKWGLVAIPKEFFNKKGEFQKSKFEDERGVPVIIEKDEDEIPHYYYITHNASVADKVIEMIVRITEDNPKHYRYSNIFAY